MPKLTPNNPGPFSESYFSILCKTFLAPILLNPNLLIIALSSNNLKILGFLFPYCGVTVTVPISTNPKPNLIKPSKASPFLSKPAAKPIGLVNFRLHTFTLSMGSSGLIFFLKLLKNLIAKLCASSGGTKFKIGKIFLYNFSNNFFINYKTNFFNLYI